MQKKISRKWDEIVRKKTSNKISKKEEERRRKKRKEKRRRREKKREEERAEIKKKEMKKCKRRMTETATFCLQRLIKVKVKQTSHFSSVASRTCANRQKTVSGNWVHFTECVLCYHSYTETVYFIFHTKTVCIAKICAEEEQKWVKWEKTNCKTKKG